MSSTAQSALHRLSALGQSVWVDFLSREEIRGGKLQSLIDNDAVVGATSNPTIFQKAMTAGDAYDEQLHQLPGSRDATDSFWALAEQDVREGCEVFRPVFDRTDGRDGFVSIEGDPRGVYSVASFFVSRIDTEADRRLDEIGGHDELKGKLAIANAKLAYQHYRESFAGPRWDFLAAKGATPQRVLWASTSTKNPAFPDTLYVEELIGQDTINTMPEETIRAYQDHGDPKPRLLEGLDDARRVFAGLEE